MKDTKQSRVVLVTCATLGEARKIANSAVSKRMAACVNVVLSAVESVYAWKGKIERGREYLLIIKTTAKRISVLEKEVKRLHSYEVPEFIVLSVTYGSKEYLSWLSKNVAARK